jgi:hypothetical protein
VLFQKSTRFVNLTAQGAALIFAVLTFTIGYGLISYQSIVETDPTIKKGEDLRCYRQIVERIHGGEEYYEAAGSELRSRGYPTRSVFNWRLPTLAWLLGHLPNLNAGKVLAITLAFTTLIVWVGALKKEGSFAQILVGTFFLLGPAIYGLLPEVFLAHEFWAGTCITLSLVAYARGWRIVAIAFGLFALFLRELTLPFICIMLVASYLEGRRLETLVWLIGIVVFVIILAVHSATVSSLIQEGDLAQKEGWIVFGGWSFVLRTAHMHPYLYIAPPWATAVLLPFILLGLAGWRGLFGSRVALTAGLYILSFCFVGKPFNQYWGMMYANFMLLGLMMVPYSLLDLWGCLSRRKGNEIIHRNPSF